MKRKLLIATVLLATFYGGLFVGSIPKNPMVAGSTQTLQKLDTYKLWSLVNTERTSKGLQPLNLSQKLNNSAQAKCDDLVKENYFEHDSPRGEKPWNKIFEYYGDYQTAGENLAYGFATSSDIVTGWMNSPEHRKNILKKEYADVGYAYCHSNNFVGNGPQYIVVQHFASK